MKKSSIEKAINWKIDDWLKSIEDEKLRNDLKSKIIVTGGCIVSLLTGEKVNDYDIYFTDKEITKRVAEYYCSKFNEANYVQRTGSIVKEDDKGNITIFIQSTGILIDKDEMETVSEYEDSIKIKDPTETNEKPKYRPVFLSSNAITLSNNIQLIIRFYGDAKEIHKNFDFLHCTCYWEGATRKITWTTEALDCIINKTLFYRGSKYPLCSVIRTKKFIQRGWNINAGQYLKMLFQVSELDLTNLDVLYDQLTGVDSAYFLMAIEQLKKLKEEKEANGGCFTFDSTYLAAIVDRIFG